MATIADTITQIKASNIDLNDKIYLSKNEDNIAYSLKISELIENLKSNIIPSFKNYSIYTENTQNIQQKFGFSATDTSQEFWDALANNVVHGNASRIQYGDIVYMPIAWLTNVNLWQVVDINRYGNDLIFRPYATQSFGYGQHNNNEKISTMGWSGSNIRSQFNGELGINKIPANSPIKTAGLNKLIDNACGGHLRKISRNLAKYNSNNDVWDSLEEVIDYAFLPTEKEILGTIEKQYQLEGGECFKLYQLGYNYYQPSSVASWTCSPSRLGDIGFTIIWYNDSKPVIDAANYSYTVYPCWCFGIGN